MAALRIGIVGCGRVAQRVHLPALRGISTARLVALADMDADALERAARLSPGCSRHSDLDSMLQEADLDAVLVALPSGAHARAVRTAMRQNLDVYVEKPMALDLGEADRIVEDVRARDLTLRVGLNYRFHPQLRELREAICGGHLGTIIGVQTCFASPSPELPQWKQRRATGGGALLDLAVHHFDLLTLLLDAAPEEITARTWSRQSEQDGASASLRFGAVSAQVLVSLGAAQTDRIEVLGTKARAVWDRSSAVALKFYPRRWDHSLSGRVRRMGREFTALRSSLTRVVRPRPEPSYARALREFVEASRGAPADEFAPTARVGRDALALVLAAERSAASGRSVSP